MALTEKSRPFLFCTDGCSDISIYYVNKVMKKIESLINGANLSTYRIRVVHGFNRGNSIQSNGNLKVQLDNR